LTEGTTWGQWVRSAAQALTAAGASTPRLDAEVLLAHSLQVERIRLHMYPERLLTAAEATAVSRLLERRLAQEPVAYILETQEFMGLDFRVSPAVLIPRPETELLVEQVACWLKNKGRLPEAILWGADIGTGSGCIAVALAKLVPEIRMLAVDLSEAALAVAADNIQHHGLAHRVMPLAGDLLAPVAAYLKKDCGDDQRAFHTGNLLDVIVSNPPYINEKEMAALSPSVASYEPSSALAGGVDGLDYYRRLVVEAPSLLKPGGLLAFEIGHDQGRAVGNLMETCGFQTVKCLPDLAGIDRVVTGIWPGEGR